MNFKMIWFFIGWILRITGAFLIFPIITSIVYKEQEGFVYAAVAVGSFILGSLILLVKPKNNSFFAKESFVAVSLSWIVMSAVGALPFRLTGEIPNYIDAIFESISGFTTTGASILTNVEGLSYTSLLWRSLTHWIGGMGVLVFILAILPTSGGQNLLLMQTESPGPSVGKFVPKLQNTAVYLYGIYLFLTIVEFIALLIAKTPVFDAICISIGTAGTGGFGIKNDGMASYSTATLVIITVFMLLFGINFNFYFFVLMRRMKEAFKIQEIRVYLGIYFAAVVAICINVYHAFGYLGDNLKMIAFHVSSLMTSTGFIACDYEMWPSFSKGLLVLVSIFGACAGSTGGGVKVSRIMIYFKSIALEVERFIHPRSVKTLTLEKKVVSKDVLRQTNIFLMLYMAIIIFSTLIVSLDGFDFTTNLTSVLATINNTGPGLSMVGPTGNFSEFSILSKLVLCFSMLAGRLELYPMIILLAPATWKRN